MTDATNTARERAIRELALEIDWLRGRLAVAEVRDVSRDQQIAALLTERDRLVAWLRAHYAEAVEAQHAAGVCGRRHDYWCRTGNAYTSAAALLHLGEDPTP
jgi:hypothetical protein